MYYSGWELELEKSTSDGEGLLQSYLIWVCTATSTRRTRRFGMKSAVYTGSTYALAGQTVETLRRPCPNFVNWTDSVSLKYPDAPADQFYTNHINPYCRASHVLVGIPVALYAVQMVAYCRGSAGGRTPKAPLTG